MIDWANLTWFQTILVAVIGLFACIGIITFTALVIKFANEHRIDDLNDFYDGCDMQKVRDQWE